MHSSLVARTIFPMLEASRASYPVKFHSPGEDERHFSPEKLNKLNAKISTKLHAIVRRINRKKEEE